MAAEVLTEQNEEPVRVLDEPERVHGWRVEMLVEGGFTVRQAERLAGKVDWHDAVALLEKTEHAYDILR